uniref:Putative methyltransferase n=1 Tax=viral metagenome TaxID=1070528 RepID=A0A6M3M7A9_9ZZZZ
MNLDNLPWIHLEDKDAAYQVVKFLPDNPVILEAGCCAAEDTLRFKKIWPESTVYAFEPNPDLYEIAKKNIGDTKGIYLYPYALSDKEEKRTFYMSKFMPGASSFFEDNSKNVEVPQSVLDSLRLTREEYIPSYLDESITVQCLTIDNWRKKNNIGQIDYFWLDAEGAEVLILKGTNETLEKVRVISIEFSFVEFRKGWVQFDELYEFLTTHGFFIHAIWQAHENWCGNAIFLNREII